METPEIVVNRDYEGVFEGRVRSAVKLNQDNGKAMKSKIIIDSGPYRSYCMSYSRGENSVELDFYAASRVFGFQHTIQDIAKVIEA